VCGGAARSTAWTTPERSIDALRGPLRGCSQRGRALCPNRCSKGHSKSPSHLRSFRRLTSSESPAVQIRAKADATSRQPAERPPQRGPDRPSDAAVLALQAAAGNRAVAALLGGSSRVHVQLSGEGEPPVSGEELGKAIAKDIKGLERGKRLAIAERVSAARLPQAQAVRAAEVASQELFGRVAPIETLPNGARVVPSVQAGPNQPVFIVHADGTVQPARATLTPRLAPTPGLDVTNIVIEGGGPTGGGGPRGGPTGGAGAGGTGSPSDTGGAKSGGGGSSTSAKGGGGASQAPKVTPPGGGQVRGGAVVANGAAIAYSLMFGYFSSKIADQERQNIKQGFKLFVEPEVEQHYDRWQKFWAQKPSARPDGTLYLVFSYDVHFEKDSHWLLGDFFFYKGTDFVGAFPSPIKWNFRSPPASMSERAGFRDPPLTQRFYVSIVLSEPADRAATTAPAR
jgi:hypothetical protein